MAQATSEYLNRPLRTHEQAKRDKLKNMEDDAFAFVAGRVLDLTDERLKELYHEVWTELIRRGAETVREAAE